MRNISSAFKTALVNDHRAYLEYADFVLTDSTELHLTGADFWQNGFSIEDAVSSGGKFQLGSAIINKATLVLNNIYEEYDEYEFYGAIVTLSIGLELNGAVEKIQLGKYTVVEHPTYNGSLITIEMYDNMWKFDRPYNESDRQTPDPLVYPATLDTIVRDACTKCGLTLITTDFPNKSFVVAERPDDEKLTFREVLAYAAQIAGCYARCNQNGYLTLQWFNQSALTSARTTDNVSGVHYINQLYSKRFSTDDVVITGVRVSIQVEREVQEEGHDYTTTTYEEVEYLYGSTGYVISVEDNPLIAEEQVQTVATYLGTRINGFAFRTADVSHGSDPSIEAGDVMLCIDVKNKRYPMLVSSTKFHVGNAQKTQSIAEDPVRNTSARYTAETKNYVETRKLLAAEKTDRERITQDLADRIDNAQGLFETQVTDVGGGVITYLHDKPLLEDSDIQIKISTVGVTVTPNGTAEIPTWYGLTVDGQLIANILTTSGINADWINTGQLVIRSGGTEIFFADVDTGVVRISGNAITITAGDYLDTAITNTARTSTRTVLDNAQAYGLGCKVNHSTFNDTANANCYYHGYSTLGNATDADGWVQWNGEKVTIPKGRKIQPGSTMPFGATLYSVYRKSDQSWHDVTWIESSNTWEANTYSGSTPSARTTWTWNEPSDIVLASYSVASASSAITDLKLFTPPKKFSELAEVASMKAKLYTDTTLSDFATTVNAEISDIQAQLDGVVDTYYYPYTPTTSNIPASDWTTTALKEEHEGDLFLDTSTGKSYRWVNENNVWQWKEIPDTASAQALIAAQNAQDTADHKRRVFVSQPYTPYDIGDLWMQGSTGDIMTCINNRATGDYVFTDWSKLNKYTDDTATNALAIRVTDLETETVAYYMEVSQAAIVKANDGTYTPSTITLSAKSQKIGEALSAYSGRFTIETQSGSTWTTQYTSSSNESSKTYTIPSDITAIRCSLYQAGGTTTLLDQQTVPIVSDGVVGRDGERGTGVYKITTAPSSYTTPTGGFTPTYRISLATVKTQAGVTEVLIGDVIEYSYYHYPVGYVDTSYVYTGARTSIRGANGQDGQDGQDGADGKDAYTVILTNESHGFAGSATNAAIASSVTTEVLAWKGTTPVTPSSITISQTPTGMTATRNGTVITIAVTSAMVTRQGTLTITATVDGQSFPLTFSYTLNPAGERGATWYPGTAITGQSTTPTVYPNTGIVNAIIDDHYLNTSTQDVYVCTLGGNANTAKWKYEQNIKGTEGTPGTAGSNAYLHVKYSDDGGITFTGNTGEDPGEWIGTYTDSTQADSTTPSDYTWAKIKGDTGENGEDAYFLETPFTWVNNGTRAEFEAIIYKGDTIVTDEYPIAWFEWFLRNEDGENRIAIGKTCSVAKTSLGYGSTITCIFTTYDNRNAQLLTRSGKGLLTRSGLKATTFIQADGDQKITELPYKISPELLPNDYIMGIDAADGYQTSIADFADYILNNNFSTRNLMTYPYSDQSRVESGVTYVDNTDGSITASGTATANTTFEFKAYNANFTLPPGSYFINQPNNASTTTCRFRIDGYKMGEFVKSYVSGASKRITILGDDDIDSLECVLIVYAGYNMNNVTFTPQIYREVPYVSARQAIGNRLYRYGDTMEISPLVLRSHNISNSIPQATTGGQCYLSFNNVNNYQTGWVQSQMTGDGYSVINLYSRFPNTTQYAYVRLGVTEGGTQWVGVSSPAAWRTAIGTINKAGDSMTGSLRINGTDTVGTTPSSNYYSPAFNVCDKNGTAMGYYNHFYYTTGTLGIQLGAQRSISGTMKYNTLLLGLDTNGNPTVGLSGTNIATAWRTALGAANKAGDTITGTYNFKIGSEHPVQAYFSHVEGRIGQTAPSAGEYFSPIFCMDKNNRLIFYMQGSRSTSNNLSMTYGVRRHSSDGSSYYTNYFQLGLDNSGNGFINISHPAAWRSAIGALSTGGGTVTGDIIRKITSVDASKANNNVSSSVYPAFIITDNSDRILARFEAVAESSGAIASYWYVRNYNTSGTQTGQKGIRMSMNKSGTLTYAIGDAVNFRSALDLGNQITTRAVSGTIGKAYGSSVALTAPTVSGYKFVAWVHAWSSGWVAPISTNMPTDVSAMFWNALSGSTSGTGTVYALALYIRNP